MKNILKLIGVIALVAVIGFSIIACNKSGNSSSKSSGGGGKSLNSPEALKEYLDSQPANGPNNPIKVSMGANAPMLPKIAEAINSAGKYVSLNLTGNALTNIEGLGGCKILTSVTIPNSVTDIGGGAFEGCTSLTSVTIPDSVTSIGNTAFYNCTSLTSVTIPNSVTSIGNNAFAYCTSLTAINVDAGNSAYISDNGVLYNKTKTTLIRYPAGKTGTTFTIPNSVTSIESGAFSWCTGLASVTIGNGVTSIGEYAFSIGTSLTSVTFATGSNIPDANFGYRAFPEGSSGAGDTLKTAYSTGKAGTYTRSANGSTWTK